MKWLIFILFFLPVIGFSQLGFPFAIQAGSSAEAADYIPDAFDISNVSRSTGTPYDENQQITGINQTITLGLAANAGTMFSFYASVDNNPNSSWPSGTWHRLVNMIVQEIPCENNQYLHIHYWGDYQYNYFTVYIRNITDSNTLLDQFNVEYIDHDQGGGE